MRSVPHHLYGVLDPIESADAGSYMRLAKPVIEEIQSRGKTPVITGGSGLYLKFLTHGPAPLPHRRCRHSAPNSTPARSRIWWRNSSALDPVEAARTALQNRRFVSRALEICLLTGRKASDLRDQWEPKTREISASLARLCHPAPARRSCMPASRRAPGRCSMAVRSRKSPR